MAKTSKPAGINPERAVRGVVKAMRKARVPYMLIGALALSAWGRPRATLDIDFMVFAADIPEKLIAELASLGFIRDLAWERHNPFLKGIHARFHSNRLILDVLLARDDHHYAAFKRRKKKNYKGSFIWLPSPDDLILLKLRAGRHADFEDVIGIMQRAGRKLDLGYLSRWARRLGLVEELNYTLDSGFLEKKTRSTDAKKG